MPNDARRLVAAIPITVITLAIAPAPVFAQERLTIEQAMTRARSVTLAAQALRAGTTAAEARVGEARAGYLPRVDVTQSVERGDQPVYVFGALLSQRRFGAANFDVATLNNPPATTNVRTALGIDQPIFDAGRTWLAVRRAALDRELASAEQARGEQDLALAAAGAFVRVLQLEATVEAIGAAVAAAESDLERARARREAGLVTDADVMAIEVHLADVRQREIAANGDLMVARMTLNDAIGLPLDQTVALVRPASNEPSSDVAAMTREALTARPERHEADLRVQRADTERRLARSAFLPTVAVRGGWEFNGGTWTTQRSAWIIGAHVQWNVFNGFADRARLGAAEAAGQRAGAERDRLLEQIALDVRSAAIQLESARGRAEVARAALAQSRESQRIIRDRYETGLASVTDLLRAAEAVMDADARATAAEMDVMLESVKLERARGRL